MSELWNDLLYTDVLRSDGFVVDYAVLTTYSMELPQLLSIPSALGAIDLDDDALRTPPLVLEAVDRSAGKFAVFCNAGSIAAPPAGNKVYSLLERSVVPISLPAKGAGFANFHLPKHHRHERQVPQLPVIPACRRRRATSKSGTWAYGEAWGVRPRTGDPRGAVRGHGAESILRARTHHRHP